MCICECVFASYTLYLHLANQLSYNLECHHFTKIKNGLITSGLYDSGQVLSVVSAHCPIGKTTVAMDDGYALSAVMFTWVVRLKIRTTTK